MLVGQYQWSAAVRGCGSVPLIGWRRSAGARAIMAVISGSAFAVTPPLPALGADLSQTSVSGISSGGFMASQLAMVKRLGEPRPPAR